jgi:predicted GNAT family acetyltransferase
MPGHAALSHRVERIGSAAEFLGATDSLRSADPLLTNVVGSVAMSVVAGMTYESEMWLVVRDEADRVVGAAMRTAPWALLVTPMNDAAAAVLGEYVRNNAPDVPGVNGPVEAAHAVVAAMGSQARVRMRDVLRVLTALGEPPSCPGTVRRAELDDLDLVVEWFTAFVVEAGLPPHVRESRLRASISSGQMYFWDDATGQPVAMAGHAEPVATPSGSVARIGPVYTPREFRRRGYGSAITYAVAAELTSRCDQVMLYADAANPDSNNIYQRLGFEEVAETVELDLV